MKLVEVFERMGLVERSKDESLPEGDNSKPMPGEASGDAITAEVFAGAASHAPGDADLSSRPGESSIEENRPLEEIYAAAGIAESPFSADKLLKLLDALGNLPDDTRKQAVIAMDAAEDSWTIEDPLLDARRRIQALEEEKRRLAERADWAEAQSAKELEAQDQYERQAVAQIRQQIADLEALMERELRSVAEGREHIKAQCQLTREVCRRERERLEAEIARLQRIEKLFAVDIADSNAHITQQKGRENG